ncbi:anti-sigma factor domain-containing protein [Streptomyces sp. HMX112]|uniref:anti-sigma factor n=1 Tax=Streptomyces sp. HMX112 TaxID=3390850 RepID=UPI003A808FF2
MSEDHMHAPTGAYALDALPDDEREAFERHLRGCPACAQEVKELRATAARLGTAMSAAPPQALRGQVLERVRSVRQLPPRVGHDTPHSPAGRHRYLPRMVLAACVAAATAFGGVAAWQYQDARLAEQRAEQARAETADMARVLSAPDARTITGKVKGGARAAVVVSRSENSAVFLASDLPELPEDKTYQLWFDDGGKMRPAGLVTHDGSRLMEGDVGRASGVGVTVEPSGGSPQPTSTPLALLGLPT